MDTLSDEMLIEIFQWLPPRTRGECRLVCRRWDQICQSYMLIKDEKIVFLGEYDLDVVAPLLRFDNRRILNLHFIGKSFHRINLEISFWKSYGERIKSIHLIHGAFNFICLKTIIEFCPNLRSIKLQCYKAFLTWLTNFDAFEKMNLIAPSVTSFHFQVYCQESGFLTTYKLDKILTVFPNLVDLELEFQCALPRVLSNENVNVYSDKMFSIHGCLQILCGIAKNLKKLHFRMGESYSYCVDVTTLLSKLQNIEELTLIPSMSFVGVDLVQPYAPLLKLTRLTSLNLSMSSFKLNRSVTEFIPLILHEFPRLRHLYLDVIDTLELNEVLIENLVSSALKTLSLSFKTLILGANVEQYNSSNVNRKLETISIRSSGPPKAHAYVHLFSILPRYFQNVNDLTVSRPDDRILQHIFEYQERLKKLRLESCSSCTDFGFTGLSDSVTTEEGQITYCISELSNLEFLHINPADKITEKTFTCLVLPQLRTLQLVKYGHSEMSLYLFRNPMPYLAKFEFLIEYSDLLEVLKLDFTQFVPQEEVEEMLRPFKRLRSVQISGPKTTQTGGKSTYSYGRFFEICPSLRKFVHNNTCCHINTLTKKLVIVQFDYINQFPDYVLD